MDLRMGKLLNASASWVSLRWAGTFPDVLAAPVEPADTATLRL